MDDFFVRSTHITTTSPSLSLPSVSPHLLVGQSSYRPPSLALLPAHPCRLPGFVHAFFHLELLPLNFQEAGEHSHDANSACYNYHDPLSPLRVVWASLPITMATQLDTRHLSTTYSVPEPTLQSLLDAPTAELVHSFLERLAAFAKEHDILKAEKLRSDVELEAAVRGGENRARQMRDSVQNNLAQVETLRRQLGDSGWFPCLGSLHT